MQDSVVSPLNGNNFYTSPFSANSGSSLSYAAPTYLGNSNIQQQQQSGSFNVDQAANLAGKAYNQFSSGNSGTGIFNGLKNNINQFGTNFGFASPAGSTLDVATGTAAFQGPTLNGSPLGALQGPTAGITPGAASSATLSGTLGAAGIGAFAGNFLGKIGGNSTGGSIGGGIGAAIGNMIVPGIGGIVGGLLGGIGGGFFGNSKPSDKTMVGGINWALGREEDTYKNTQSSTGDKYSDTNAAIRDTAQTGSANFVKFLLQNGATPKTDSPYANTNMLLKVGSRDGMQVGFQGNNMPEPQYVTNTQDTGQFFNDINSTIIGNYNIPTELQEKLKNMDLMSFYGKGGNTSAPAAIPTAPGVSLTEGQFAKFMETYNKPTGTQA